jgi:TPR repeat protein
MKEVLDRLKEFIDKPTNDDQTDILDNSTVSNNDEIEETKNSKIPSDINSTGSSIANFNTNDVENLDFSDEINGKIEIKEQEKMSNDKTDDLEINITSNINEIKNSNFSSVVDKFEIKETIEVKEESNDQPDKLENIISNNESSDFSFAADKFTPNINEIKNSNFSSVVDKFEIKETIEVKEESNDQPDKLDNIISNNESSDFPDKFEIKETIEVTEKEKESNDQTGNNESNNSKIKDSNFPCFSASYDSVKSVIDEIVDQIFKGGNIEVILDNYNSEKIFDWLLYNQNDSNSIFLLGNFYDSGIVTIVNKRKAFELYREAAFKGHIIAQHNVALMYKNGKEVDKNHKLAFEFFKKSAEGKYLDGINMTGECYYKGIGTNINKQKAFSLFQLAAISGNSNAQYNIAQMYKNGEVVDKNYKTAFKFYKKSAEGEYLDGIFMLGFCYSNGIGTDVDKGEAFKWYKKAAKLGHHLAQYNLGLMYEKGIFVEQDDDIALKYYRKSVGEGGLNVMTMLSDCFDGEFEDSDKEFAKNKYLSMLDVLFDGFHKEDKVELYQSFAKVNNKIGKIDLPKITEDYKVGEGIVKGFTNLLYEGKDELSKVFN